MPMEIHALEEADIAKIGQRCTVISTGTSYKNKQFVEVGDTLKIVAKMGSRGNLLWFFNERTEASEFLLGGALIERIKE